MRAGRGLSAVVGRAWLPVRVQAGLVGCKAVSGAQAALGGDEREDAQKSVLEWFFRKGMNMTELNQIHSALTNAELSHSSFRLHVALIAALNGRCNSYFSPVSITGLKALVPGVRGKPMSTSVFRENLKELQAAGLIETVPSNRRKELVFVRLLNSNAESSEHVKRQARHELLPGEVPWPPDGSFVPLKNWNHLHKGRAGARKTV